jgi:hypothetical protein
MDTFETYEGTDEATKVTLDGLIHMLSLSVGVRVMRCAEFELSTSGAKNGLPESACKNGITIRNQGSWHAMQTVHIINEKLSNLSSGVGMLQGNEMCKLREFIHNDQQAIELS